MFSTSVAHLAVHIFQFYPKRLIHKRIYNWICRVVYKISVENHNIVRYEFLSH